MSVWKSCLERLEGELSPQQFNTWIRPLQVVENHDSIRLYAPNRFVLDWINEQHLEQIRAHIKSLSEHDECAVSIEVGSQLLNKTKKKSDSKFNSP